MAVLVGNVHFTMLVAVATMIAVVVVVSFKLIGVVEERKEEE